MVTDVDGDDDDDDEEAAEKENVAEEETIHSFTMSESRCNISDCLFSSYDLLCVLF